MAPPTFDDLFAVMADAAAGSRAARVAIPETPRLADTATRFAMELNFLLDEIGVQMDELCYMVAHDLHAPLRTVMGFAQMFQETYGPAIDGQGREWLEKIVTSAHRMTDLLDALGQLAQVTRTEVRREVVDLTAIVRETIVQLAAAEPARRVTVEIEDGVMAEVDRRLVRILITNLAGNAWKFTREVPAPRIQFGREAGVDAFFVRDNGVGFDATFVHKLFAPFQRRHRMSDLPGTGIGLATVQRVVERHGGTVWAEGAVGKGATFFFRLGDRRKRGVISASSSSSSR